MHCDLGSGKTTVNLRLLLIEARRYLKAVKSDQKLAMLSKTCPFQQLFVTVSPVLCRAIEDQYKELLKSTPDSKGISALPPPRIITYKQFLKDVNDILPPERRHEKYQPTDCESRDLYGGGGLSGGGVKLNISKYREVDFHVFKNFYYPRLSEAVKKKFDSNVVYTEIMTSIKGSLQAISTAGGRLSRTEYMNLKDTNAELTSTSRGILYDGFEAYEVQKSRSGEYDLQDVVFHVFNQCTQIRLQKTRMQREAIFPQFYFHKVYIDEVQDLTPSQIALFGFFCSVRSGGRFVFSGDTAQTVSLYIFMYICIFIF